MLTWKDGYDGAKSTMFEIVLFHDFVFSILIFVGCFVGGCLFLNVSKKKTSSSYVEFGILEVIWTVLPILILVIMFIPSSMLLYKKEKQNQGLVNQMICVIGHQWYWEYKYEGLSYNSYSKSSLDKGQSRLLETSSPVFLEPNSSVLLNITSDDVLHCFAVPALGVKVDAVPGRMNEFILNSGYSGVFTGQCSEICGALHANMPICLIVGEF